MPSPTRSDTLMRCARVFLGRSSEIPVGLELAGWSSLGNTSPASVMTVSGDSSFVFSGLLGGGDGGGVLFTSGPLARALVLSITLISSGQQVRKRSLRSPADRELNKKSGSSKILVHLPKPCRSTPMSKWFVSSSDHFRLGLLERFLEILGLGTGWSGSGDMRGGL